MPLNIGKKITNFRRTRDITIQDLADMTGLSTSLISQLERGIGNPTLSALTALAEAMRITPSELLSTQIENKELICRKDARITVRQDDNLTLKSMLVEDLLNTSLSVLQLEIQPHAYSSGRFEVHAEEECLCVLAGEVVMMFEGEEFLLHRGDSIRVLPKRLHLLRNDGDTPAVAVNIKCKVQY